MLRMCGLGAFRRWGRQVWLTRKVARGVDGVHQVVALHGSVEGRGQGDGAGVVDADIDSAVGLDGLRHRLLHLIFEADIADQRQGVATGVADLLGGGVDGARQPGMWFGGFGGDGDVGAVPCRAQGDGQSDSPARSGNEECPAAEGMHGVNSSREPKKWPVLALPGKAPR